MTPALYIKPDGKVYLIENCPEEPIIPAVSELNPFYETELRDYYRHLQQAKDQSILIENQEYAFSLIKPVQDGSLCGKFPKIDTVYPMPGLKYKLRHQFWCYGEWLDCDKTHYNAHLRVNHSVQIIAILEEPVQEVKQSDWKQQDWVTTAKKMSTEEKCKRLSKKLENKRLEKLKQEEQEESQEDIWEEILNYCESPIYDNKLLNHLKQHFKIQRR